MKMARTDFMMPNKTSLSQALKNNVRNKALTIPIMRPIPRRIIRKKAQQVFELTVGPLFGSIISDLQNLAHLGRPGSSRISNILSQSQRIKVLLTF